MQRSVITGCGSYLPARVLSNAWFEERLETTDAWIRERTGICERHIAAEGEVTSDLAAAAAKTALKSAGISAEDVDLLILATSTPDDTIPSTATKTQFKLGMRNGAAFDLNAACSGFVYALSVADSMLRGGQGKRALVIGAETFSRIIDWNDRGTCILFGDGAGAVLLEIGKGEGTSQDRGVLHTALRSDGAYYDILKTTGGVSSTRSTGTLFMAGREVFRHAVEKMSAALESGMQAMSLPLSGLDWVIPHQANIRIMEAMAKRLEFPIEKVISTVGRHANTSAASIPLALASGLAENRIKSGHLIGMPALGAGLTWGNCIIRL